ncbi:MAG: Glutathione synthetase [Ramalina farinacea]|uniref:glutathione synthase n=1 Tax=Ramalina farinacea TaxID=258253 RepID=A0AA43QS49_9LECA|nr:Glutathione synthetase [Ramalina farinacea]
MYYKIPVFRLPFGSVLDHTSIPPQDKGRPLLYHPPSLSSERFEVSTLYFRAGYSPDEYDSSSAWQARLHLERSAAIKCPSILTHLAGSKKIQQILAMPLSPHLDRFLANTSYKGNVDRLRATFATIYPLDDSEQGRQALSIARDSGKSLKYVLKPQREGGGNNIYGAKIPDHLSSLGDDERKYRSHILMELIEPPALSNSILRNGEVQSGGVIGELGIYGTCLWRATDEGRIGSRTLLNEEAGYLLRTKGRESEEGGVAAGFGAVDSVCLVDHL